MTDFAGPGYVTIDGTVFEIYVPETSASASRPLDPEINIRQLKTYPGKELQGDPTVRSHDYLSTLGISDQSGGLGVIDHRAGQTDQRYRQATADVSAPSKWVTQRRYRKPADKTGVARILGTLWDGTNRRLFAAWGTDIYEYTPAAQDAGSWADTGDNLGSAPLDVGATPFEGTGAKKLMIPRGAAGYSYYDGTTCTDVAASGTQPGVMDFCVFGGTNCLAVDSDGYIWSSIGGTAWERYEEVRIDGYTEPYGILEYRDLSGEPIAFINTTDGLWTFDPYGPSLYKSGLELVNHTTMGRAAAVWESLYHISAGVDVRQFNGTENRPIGLDSDDGIEHTDGNTYICSMDTSNNDLYALVRHDANSEDAAPGLFRWDGNGWFEVWRGDPNDDVDTRPTIQNVHVSGARDDYRVHWAFGSSIWNMNLEIGDRNPKRILERYNQFEFENEGDWWMGWWDAGLPGSDKVAVSLAVRMSFFGDEDFVAIFPEFGYRTTDGVITALSDPFAVLVDGTFEEAVLPASGPLPNGTYFFRMADDRSGVHFDELELYMNLHSGTVVKWIALYYLRQMAGSYGWTVTFDMRKEVNGKSPREQREALELMFEEGSVYRLSYNREEYYVAFSTWEGVEWTGKSEDRSLASVTLFQVRDRP